MTGCIFDKMSEWNPDRSVVGLASSHSSSDSRTQYYRADSKIMESYINNPELHRNAVIIPKWRAVLSSITMASASTKSVLCVNAATGALT